MISEQALQEFKVIWKKEFDQDISDKEAAEQALNLLNLFDAIYRPIKKESLNEYEKSRQTAI